MKLLLVFTVIAVGLSFCFDFQKTILGIKKGLAQFLKLMPLLIIVLLAVSATLYVIPSERLSVWMGQSSGVLGVMTAAFVGSVMLIPGFIAYPLAGILVENGVGYQITAVFITTLMMVGLATLPMEARYFGWKSAVMRNGLSFAGALVVGVLVGLLI